MHKGVHGVQGRRGTRNSLRDGDSAHPVVDKQHVVEGGRGVLQLERKMRRELEQLNRETGCIRVTGAKSVSGDVDRSLVDTVDLEIKSLIDEAFHLKDGASAKSRALGGVKASLERVDERCGKPRVHPFDKELIETASTELPCATTREVSFAATEATKEDTEIEHWLPNAINVEARTMLQQLKLLDDSTNLNFHQIATLTACQLNGRGESGSIAHTRKIRFGEREKIEEVGEVVNGGGDGGAREEHVLQRLKQHATTRVDLSILVTADGERGFALVDEDLADITQTDITEKVEQSITMRFVTTLDVKIGAINSAIDADRETGIVTEANKVATILRVDEPGEGVTEGSGRGRSDERKPDASVNKVETGESILKEAGVDKTLE